MTTRKRKINSKITKKKHRKYNRKNNSKKHNKKKNDKIGGVLTYLMKICKDGLCSMKEFIHDKTTCGTYYSNKYDKLSSLGYEKMMDKSKIGEYLNEEKYIKEIIYLERSEVESRHAGIKGFFNLINDFKDKKFDKVFIFNSSLRFYMAAKIGGIKNINSYKLLRKKNQHIIETAKKFLRDTLKIDVKENPAINPKSDTVAQAKKDYSINNDEINIVSCHQNCNEWFGKNIPLSVIKDYYNSSLIFNSDGKNPILRLKVPSYRGKIIIEIFNENKQLVDANFINKNDDVICIIENLGLEFFNKKFLSEYEILKIKVFKKNEERKIPSGYIFSDKSNINLNKLPNEDILESTNNQHNIINKDNDTINENFNIEIN